ncbi:pentapeptide repeat-containing protein [Algoriphagus namhaensis]
MAFYSDETFQGINFLKEDLKKGEYESCRFVRCNLSGVDLSGFRIEDCVFESCELSNCKVFKTGFQQVSFKDCKMLGIHFYTCNPFLLELEFVACQLDYSSFTKLPLKGTKLENCRMYETDFTAADLSGGSFRGSDLSGAIFEQTILEKTDFRTAQNFSLDPELNRLKEAFFDVTGLAGLLGKHRLNIDF